MFSYCCFISALQCNNCNSISTVIYFYFLFTLFTSSSVLQCGSVRIELKLYFETFLYFRHAWASFRASSNMNCRLLPEYQFLSWAVEKQCWTEWLCWEIALEPKTRKTTYEKESWVVRALEPASFWRENVIAVVILPRGFSDNAVAAKISWSNGSFIIWRSGEYIIVTSPEGLFRNKDYITLFIITNYDTQL